MYLLLFWAGSSNISSYHQLPQNCDLEAPCPNGKIWNPNLCKCGVADIPSSDSPSSEVPCSIHSCEFNDMAYNSNGECVCCSEYTHWNTSLEECIGGCNYPVEGCVDGEIESYPGYCFCKKCLPGYFARPDNQPYQSTHIGAPCLKCNEEEPCLTGKVWSHDLCTCVDIPSFDIPSDGIWL